MSSTEGFAVAPWVYTGRATNLLAVTVSVALAVLLVWYWAASAEGSWAGIGLPGGLAAVGLLVEVLTGTSVRTSSGPNGIRVHWGVVGWPRLHYPLDRIATAEVVDVSALWVSWGPWWTPRSTSCTVRPGPALRLHLVNGRRVTISVPDPAAAVAALDRARALR